MRFKKKNLQKREAGTGECDGAVVKNSCWLIFCQSTNRLIVSATNQET